MTERDDARDELLRQFQAAIADMQVTDLRQLVSDLSEVGGHGARSAARPDLRRPPLDDVRTFRLRIDLDGAEPPIWRRLDVRSDLTLDVVHQVIQAAFEWSDSHLHRFALGGHPFDRGAQFFLCPFDVEEAEDDGLLLAVAASTTGDVDVRPVADALGHLGWQHRDGSAVDDYELYGLAAFTTLSNVAGAPTSVRGRRRLSPAAVALARSALHRTAVADRR